MMTTIPTFIQYSIRRLSHNNLAKKEIKVIESGKEEANLSLSADDMMLNTRNPKDSTKKLLELIINSVKLQDRNLKYKNQLCFYTLIMNYQKEKSRQ